MPIQITNCDWLSFSVKMLLDAEEAHTAPRLTTPQGCSLVEFPGTNMYKKRAILYDNNGDKLLTLLWQPHSHIIDSSSLFVEVANPLLYSGKYRAVPELLQQIHPHTWQSLSRLDLCTDFQPTTAQYAVIDMLQDGSVYVQGKRTGTMWHSFAAASKFVKRTPHQLTWGSGLSQIKWKLYNKTNEIYQRTPDGRLWCSKPYIAEMWKLNGLRPDLDTWRAEVSIMGSSTLQWRGQRLGWDTLKDPDTLNALYYDLYTTRMKMRLNQGHDNKRYDKEIEFLQTPDTAGSRVQKAPPSRDTTRVAYAPTIRTLVQQLERTEVRINPNINEPLLATLRHITLSAGLRGYFAAMVGQDIESYIQEYTENNTGQHTAAP